MNDPLQQYQCVSIFFLAYKFIYTYMQTFANIFIKLKPLMEGILICFVSYIIKRVSYRSRKLKPSSCEINQSVVSF